MLCLLVSKHHRYITTKTCVLLSHSLFNMWAFILTLLSLKEKESKDHRSPVKEILERNMADQWGEYTNSKKEDKRLETEFVQQNPGYVKGEDEIEDDRYHWAECKPNYITTLYRTVQDHFTQKMKEGSNANYDPKTNFFCVCDHDYSEFTVAIPTNSWWIYIKDDIVYLVVSFLDHHKELVECATLTPCSQIYVVKDLNRAQEGDTLEATIYNKVVVNSVLGTENSYSVSLMLRRENFEHQEGSSTIEEIDHWITVKDDREMESYLDSGFMW